jgi:DNA-binding response OmpR family regulator
VKSVLVAEDDPDVARILTEAIAERLHVATDVVANGALVTDAIAERCPDLLILDISLPGLSGLDVFDLVRNDPRWYGVPILFLTSTPERAATVFATTGEHRIMSKPFDLDALVATVDEMIEVRAAA